MSKYASKKIPAACKWYPCDQLEPADQLVILRGMPDWYCARHAKMARNEEAKRR